MLLQRSHKGSVLISVQRYNRHQVKMTQREPMVIQNPDVGQKIILLALDLSLTIAQ